ncbi:aryl-hydrocarbon-interacting protein-like 1 [Boleophthalmus pectinirostris]|uniref:aryl-hydrocarbon-interacting protein-like 1 n=1 Tax=Boleophthalmus pectinirostris TaxID=150288 RepID=UPI00243308B5|nr:aryl-hydrocarbon-interacting protein-like 1 [Boleophthalmus pectinirostris]
MEEDTYLLKHPGVKKKILAGGSGPLPHFPPGTKLVFHFQTLLDNFERTVIDDSRCAGRPAEIFVGKMFKLEVWETLLTSMRIGEVAEFWCDAIHTGLYPIVSKGMRLIAQGKDPLEGQRHMCGMGNLFHYHSTGFPELDELMRTPQPLIFIMELLQVGDPMSYHRESWMMEKDEKLQTVPILHMQGNALVKQQKFREAASKYKEAVLLLKTVQSREMPGDIDYINLGRMIIPLELNYCQCMLELEEYYEVIEHTTELLEKHKDCVKGYYKRAKAHAAVWNEKEARRDFNMVAQLDVTLNSLVHRELRSLSESMKEKYWEEKEKYWNKLENKEEKNEGEETLETPSEEVCEDEAGDEEEQLSQASLTEGKDWQQMLRLVMLLQKEGNFLITQGKFKEASEKFKEAMEYVHHLQNTQVDQKGDDWDSLEKVRLPLVLNLSQCLLELKQHQQVVELNNKLLKKHKGNFKAIYQRARAHAALCNEEEARKDFAMVEKLDPKFRPIVRQELKKLGESVRIKHSSQNKNYWETTQEKWGPDGKETKEDQMVRDGTEKLTDQKREACDECGGESDNRKNVVEEAAANRDAVKDSDPMPIREAGDSRQSRESVGDKATEKGQRRSHDAPEPEKGTKPNKESSDQTGDGSTPFEMSRAQGAEAGTNEE